MKLKHTITEGGDELDYDSLDKKQQFKINAAQKVIGGKRLYIMETIHCCRLNLFPIFISLRKVTKNGLKT